MTRPDAIAFHIVTGFLGAGKTTLINRLLRAPELADALVIVNECGEIGLDHLLYESVSASSGARKRRLISVVLPAPRKPVTIWKAMASGRVMIDVRRRRLCCAQQLILCNHSKTSTAVTVPATPTAPTCPTRLKTFGKADTIDTETLGLAGVGRDRLCVAQPDVARSDGDAEVVGVEHGVARARAQSRKAFTTRRSSKYLHFRRFDLAVLCHAFGVMAGPVYCTKIASKLARTYTDRHGLKDAPRDCSASK